VRARDPRGSAPSRKGALSIAAAGAAGGQGVISGDDSAGNVEERNAAAESTTSDLPSQ
jgi:hypothetical protein